MPNYILRQSGLRRLMTNFMECVADKKPEA